MIAQALIQDLTREGVTLSLVADGQIAVDGPRAAIDRWLPEIREAKPELLAILSNPTNDAAIHHRWLVTQPDGERFTLMRTPPANLAEIAADYPLAQVEPEPERPPGPPLHRDDVALAYALLRHWGEDDLATGSEYLDGLARNPEWLRQMRDTAVNLGLATFDPAPEQLIKDASPVAICALCRHWAPNPTNPTGGLGRCLTDAAASRKTSSLWPWPDAQIRCNEFDPTPVTPTARPTL